MHDYEIKTIKASIEVNKEQKIKLVKKLRKEIGDLRGKKIALLGLAFKPGTDDIRESAALDCLPLLIDDGVLINAWDPCAIDNFKRKVNLETNEIMYFNEIDQAVTGADACLIITNWPDVVNYDIKKYAQLMKEPIIIDGRNCYSLEDAKKAGIKYISIGRKEIRP